jgi:hypothetical protein
MSTSFHALQQEMLQKRLISQRQRRAAYANVKQKAADLWRNASDEDKKPDYNDFYWPSPRARMFVKYVYPHPDDKKTRLSHQEAMLVLAHKMNLSLEEFREMDPHTVAVKLGIWEILPASFAHLCKRASEGPL